MRTAQRNHGQGDLAAATKGYKAVLQLAPNHYDAAYLLAVALYQAGRVDESLESFDRAIRINPKKLSAHKDRGLILLRAGDFALALTSFDRAIELEPRLAELHINRGIALKNLGRIPEAIKSQRSAIALNPKSAQAHNNLGIALSLTDAKDAAIGSFKTAISFKPDYAEAYHNLGTALLELERFEEAVDPFQTAVKLKDDYIEAWSNLSLCFNKQSKNQEALGVLDQAVLLNGRNPVLHVNRGAILRELYHYNDALMDLRKAVQLDAKNPEAFFQLAETLACLENAPEALESYDTAISLKPDYAEAFNGRGTTLKELDRLDDAMTSIETAITLKPDFAEAYDNRGIVLAELQRFDDALASHNKAIALKPELETSHVNLGRTLAQFRKLDEALVHYNRAVALKPDNWPIHFARAWFLLSCGNYPAGFTDYEYRKLDPTSDAARKFEQPLWLGDQNLEGKTVLIHAEQGLGDTIHFARYVDLVSEVAARVYFAPQPKLMGLFQNSFRCELCDLSKDNHPDFDFHVPLLSLPFALKTTASTIPHNVPYLFADAARTEKWRDWIGDQGFRIGICWQGSKNRIDRGRSFPVAHFEPLAKIPGVRLISLHKGAGESQLNSLPNGMNIELLGEDFDQGDQAFLDSAAVIKSLDLVVTSDTAVAHLAGALAIPTWLALKRDPDWRWLLDGRGSPWYPTLRLFRQTTGGDWQAVFHEMATELKMLLQREG